MPRECPICGLDNAFHPGQTELCGRVKDLRTDVKRLRALCAEAARLIDGETRAEDGDEPFLRALEMLKAAGRGEGSK